MRSKQPRRGAGSSSSRPGARGRPHPVLGLQRLAGNRATADAIRLARQPAPPGPSPLPPPPEPASEFRPVAQALRKTGARLNESGAKVLRLQVLLNGRLGERVLHSDGVYGQKTEEQVMNFQLSLQRGPPAPPGPNPLPPPLPPPPGTDPGPAAPELEVTGDADPATVAALESAVQEAGFDLKDLEVAKEAFRLIRDKRHVLRLSLLSAIRSADRLVEADGLAEFFRGTEFDYWEAVAEHANGHFAKAKTLYQSILAEEDEGGWEGLHANCEFQLEFLARGDRPHIEFHPDPNLKEEGEE